MTKSKRPRRTSTTKSSGENCIAFVALEIYPATAGGVGILVTNTIKVLLSKGYKVLLLLDVQRHEFEKFDQVHRLDLENGHNLFCYLVEDLCKEEDVPRSGFAHSELRRSARIHLALEELKKWHQIDLIEFYDYCGPAFYALSAVGPREPAICIRLHNTVELIARKIRSGFDAERVSQFAVERSSLRGADALLTPGNIFYDEEIKPIYPDLEDDRVLYSPPVHTSVGQAEFDPRSNNVIFYGRLSTFKGLDTFVRGAVLALQNPVFSAWLDKFLIIGPEETVASAFSLSEIKNMIPEDLKPRFNFTGRVDHDQLIDHLSSAGFACFANRMESFCYAAHEIHTAGIPLIVSETAAFKDHFTDGQTAIFFDRTSRGLAEKIISLSQDEKMREKLSKAGLERADAYFVDHYADHLEALQPRVAKTSSRTSCTAFVLCDRDRSRIRDTLASLGDVPAIVLNLDESGTVRFSGFRWRATKANGDPVNLDLEAASDAAVFIRAGDKISSDWFEKAMRVLARRSDVGSVGGWVRRGGEDFAVSFNALPELGLANGPGLRTLIRLRPGSTVQEALCGWPNESEISLMLAHRAQGRLCLELAQVTADITQGISLPAQPVSNTVDVDFDRFSRDFLTLVAQPGFELPYAVDTAGRDPADRILIAETAANKSLMIVASEGGETNAEAVILRVFRGAGRIAETWSSVELQGQWSVLSDPNGPVQGALSSYRGQLRAYVTEGARIDLLCAPFAGSVRVYYRGKAQTVNLRTDSVYDVSVRFDDTIHVEAKLAKDDPLRKSDTFHERHIDLDAKEALGNVFLAKGDDDFNNWIPSRDMRSRIFPVGQFNIDGTRGEKSTLNAFAKRYGVNMFIFSSRIIPDDALASVLDTLDPDLKFGLALCSGERDIHGNAAAADRFIASAKWLSFVRRYAERFVVYGHTSGMLGLFESGGLKTVKIPNAFGEPQALQPKVRSDASVTLAAAVSHSISSNMMHMVNAAIMSSFRGVDVSALWLPEEYQYEARLIDEIDPPFKIHWYKSLADLETVDPGSMRIAMCCYPDEEWPLELSRATTLGWVPLAGSTSAFEDVPVLAQNLTVPFWEDALEIAKRIEAIASDFVVTRDEYVEFAKANETSRKEVLSAIWSS